MIKSILENDIKVIQYAKINNDKVSINPCNIDVVVYGYKDSIVDLAIINDDGIKIIKKNIGKVIKVDKYGIEIKFNITFGFNDRLYAVILPESVVKGYKTLSVVYKEA